MTKQLSTVPEIGGIPVTINNIPEILKKIDDRLAEIVGEDKKGLPVGDSVLDPFGRLKDLSPESLIHAYSMVNAKAAAYEEALTQLGANADKYPFKLNGYSADQWKESIKRQKSKTEKKDVVEKLEKARNTFRRYLSDEQRLQADVTDIAALFAS